MIYSFVPLLCGCDYTQAARLLCLFITTSSRDSHHHRAAALRLRPFVCVHDSVRLKDIISALLAQR